MAINLGTSTLALIGCVSLLQSFQCDTATVTILALAPYASESVELDWKAGPAVIPAVRLAVDRINLRKDLLQGYEVLLLEGDSGCQHVPDSTLSFVSSTFHISSAASANVVGVIGPACSESAIVIGKLGARDSVSLTQISPFATSPLLADTDEYRNTFRTLSTSLSHVTAVTELIVHNKWESIAVLHDNIYAYYLSASDTFRAISHKVGFISEIHSTNYPLGHIVERFKIIVLMAGTKLSREILCLAYHHRPQIIYPIYQWIVVDELMFISGVEFTYLQRSYNCSQEMIAQAIQGSIFTTYPFSDARDSKQELTDVDLTVEQYQQLYRVYREQHLEELVKLGRDITYNADAEEYSLSYYDATWALVLALNASLDKISLTDYKFGQPNSTSIIRQQLTQLAFEGLMGTIEFQTSHNPKPNLKIYQYFGSGNVLIGNFSDQGLYVFDDMAKFVEDTFYRRVSGVHLAATIVIILAATVLGLYTFFLHIFSILFQNHKSIKATSFRMSHFMFSGCYLILLQVFVVAVEVSDGWQTKSEEETCTRDIVFGVVCNASEWMHNIGISLVISTLCGKLWRIYIIFHNFLARSYLISDTTLTIVVAFVLTLNVVLLVCWTNFDPLLAVFEQEGIEYDGENEPIVLERVHCHCSYYSLWISLAYALILCLVMCVVILSSLNRHVNRSYFQASKSVNMMVYLLALSCFLGIVLAFVFESLDVHYTYISWQLSLLSIVFLVDVFMFSPPVFSVMEGFYYKNNITFAASTNSI